MDFNLERDTVKAFKFEKRLNSTTKGLHSDCTIKIKTDKNINSGIYVNILKMKLRKDLSSPEGSKRCRDYIRLTVNKIELPQICGELMPGQILSFNDTSGDIKIKISVATSVAFTESSEYLEWSIIATPYSDCRIFESDVFACTELSKSCISDRYLNDGIQNCPDPECADEDSCRHYSYDDLEKTPAANPSSIALSAITSLLFTMFGVGTCVWLVWKYKDCCSDGSQSQRRRRSSQSNNVSFE